MRLADYTKMCVCPADKSLYRKGRNLVTNGFVSEQFRGAKRDCAPCPLRAQWKLFCLVHNIEKLANTGYAA